MVTLEIERPLACDIGPESAAGATLGGLVIDNRLTVELDRDVAVAESDIELLPLACGFFGSDGGSDAAIESAHIMGIGRAAIGIGNLDFADAAQVDTAIATLFDFRFECEVEIFELGIGSQIAVIFMGFAFFLFGIADEHSVLSEPTIDGIFIGQAPAINVFAVEELDGIAEFKVFQVRCRGERWNSLGSELRHRDSFAVPLGVDPGHIEGICRIAHEAHDEFGVFLDADDFALSIFAFDLVDADDSEGLIAFSAFGDKDAIQRHDAAGDPENGAIQVATRGLFDFEPAGAGIGDSERPFTQERVGLGERRQCACGNYRCAGQDH